VAQLYAGATPDVLFAVGPTVPFATGAAAGYFSGGAIQVPIFVTGVPCGPAWVQVRAWAADGGGTFEEAALSRHWTGPSSVVYVVTGGCGGGVPTAPAVMYGLQYPGIPLVVQGPSERRVHPGASTSLWVVASGGVALSYQWYQGQTGDTRLPVLGATNLILNTPLLATNTTFWVRASTSAGTADSCAATVWVVPNLRTVGFDITMSSGQPNLLIHGTIGTTVQVQCSPDLNPAHWSVLTNLWQDVDPLVFVDATATNLSARYYRLALP